MSIIELGGYAGAFIAVATLVQKLVSLIAAIQKLIIRLDTMQSEIEDGREERTSFQTALIHYEYRLSQIEEMISII